MVSSQHRDSHYKDKMVSLIFIMEILILGKMIFILKWSLGTCVTHVGPYWPHDLAIWKLKLSSIQDHCYNAVSSRSRSWGARSSPSGTISGMSWRLDSSPSLWGSVVIAAAHVVCSKAACSLHSSCTRSRRRRSSRFEGASCNASRRSCSAEPNCL